MRSFKDALGREIRRGDVFAYAPPQFVEPDALEVDRIVKEWWGSFPPIPSTVGVFAEGKLQVAELVDPPTGDYSTLDQYNARILVGENAGCVVRLVAPREEKFAKRRILVRRGPHPVDVVVARFARAVWSRVRGLFERPAPVEERRLVSDEQERRLIAAEVEKRWGSW